MTPEEFKELQVAVANLKKMCLLFQGCRIHSVMTTISMFIDSYLDEIKKIDAGDAEKLRKQLIRNLGGQR